MEGVRLDGFGRNLVKGLDIYEFADKAFLVELHHVGGDAAKGEACLDSAGYHFLADVFNGGKGGATGSCLDAEAVLEVTGVNYHFCSLFGKEDIPRVLGVTDGSGRNLGTVPYAFYNHNGLYVRGRNALGHVGIFHKVVGYYHHVLCVPGVREGVTKRAADALGVFAAGEAAGVAKFVGGRCSKEGNVYLQFSVCDCTAAAAVGAEHNGLFHEAVGNGIGQLSPEA